MAKLMELKQDRAAAIAKGEAIIAAAENASRALTDNEETDLNATMAEAQGLTSRITAIES